MIITYSIVCVTTPGGHATTRAEGWGYMLYNWKTHKIDHGPVDVFKPKKSGAAISPSKIYGSPQVHDGVVTMFASQCTTIQSIGCANGNGVGRDDEGDRRRTRQARRRTSRSAMRTDGASKLQPLSISVGRYGGKLRLVALASITVRVPYLHRDRRRTRRGSSTRRASFPVARRTRASASRSRVTPS